MIDTNIAIYARDGDRGILDKLAHHHGLVVLSALSLAELQRGVFKEPADTEIRRARLAVLLQGIPILPYDEAAALTYGHILQTVGWVRSRDYDRMIAAHAISAGAVLVTNNAADFADVPGIKLENWA